MRFSMIQRIAMPLISFDLWSMSIGYRLFPVILLFSFIGCSFPQTQVKVPLPSSAERGPSQTGIASWYGPGFHGRPTASGVIYNQNDLTAAHQTLPLGTRVMVTNLNNGRSIEVNITDRGPFAKGRIIDLSYAAARTLGMIGPGTIPARLEVIDSGPHRISTIRSTLDYTLQLGSFTEIENAERLKVQLAASYPEISQASIIPLHGKDATYYRVRLGTFSTRREAEGLGRQLAGNGFSVIVVEK